MESGEVPSRGTGTPLPGGGGGRHGRHERSQVIVAESRCILKGLDGVSIYARSMIVGGGDGGGINTISSCRGREQNACHEQGGFMIIGDISHKQIASHCAHY